MPDGKAIGKSEVTIMITRFERDLILRFGYPFEEIERQLANFGEADLTKVTDSPYWWEQIILNLHISEQEHTVDITLTAALRALIERIAEHLGLS